MNQLVVVITGLHVLAHSIFGCCAHHTAPSAEGQTPLCCGAADHMDDAHWNGTHQHAHDALEDTQAAAEECDESRHAPKHDHQCKHEHCQWVTSKGDTSTEIQTIAGDLTASICAFSAIATLAMPVEAANAWESERCFAPALRSHIRLRVLLI